MNDERKVTNDFQSFEELAQRLWDLSLREELAYRGQSDAELHLQASVDRNVPQGSMYEDRLNEEGKNVKLFHDQALRYLGNLERMYASMYEINNKIACMAVMQHFGAPTRLLDWTKSVAVAAYFACIAEDRKDGAIWWLNTNAVIASVHPLWEARGFQRKPELGGEVDLNDGIFRKDVPRFVCMEYLRIPFPRAHAQRSLFTIGSRLGVDHDTVLKEQLRPDDWGKITIPASLKDQAIGYLRRAGIDALTLQHAGADRVGLSMAWGRELQK